MTIFIDQFSGETTGARLIDGQSWPRLPGESLDDFRRRLLNIVPHLKGGDRIIALSVAVMTGATILAFFEQALPRQPSASRC